MYHKKLHILQIISNLEQPFSSIISLCATFTKVHYFFEMYKIH